MFKVKLINMFLDGIVPNTVQEKKETQEYIKIVNFCTRNNIKHTILLFAFKALGDYLQVKIVAYNNQLLKAYPGITHPLVLTTNDRILVSSAVQNNVPIVATFESLENKFDESNTRLCLKGLDKYLLVYFGSLKDTVGTPVEKQFYNKLRYKTYFKLRIVDFSFEIIRKNIFDINDNDFVTNPNLDNNIKAYYCTSFLGITDETKINDTADNFVIKKLDLYYTVIGTIGKKSELYDKIHINEEKQCKNLFNDVKNRLTRRNPRGSQIDPKDLILKLIGHFERVCNNVDYIYDLLFNEYLYNNKDSFRLSFEEKINKAQEQKNKILVLKKNLEDFLISEYSKSNHEKDKDNYKIS